MLEPGEALFLSQLEQVALFEDASIGAPQLGDRSRLLPLVHQPHPCREQLACLVHVAEMWRAEADEAVELVFKLV